MQNNVPDLAACQVAGASMAYNNVAKTVQQSRPTGLAGVAGEVTAQNIDSAKWAAQIKAGEAALAAIKNIMKSALPESYHGHLDNEFVLAAVANAAAVLIRQVRPGNERAEQLADILVRASWIKIGNKVDVDAIFEELFSKLDTSRFGL